MKRVRTLTTEKKSYIPEEEREKVTYSTLLTSKKKKKDKTRGSNTIIATGGSTYGVKRQKIKSSTRPKSTTLFQQNSLNFDDLPDEVAEHIFYFLEYAGLFKSGISMSCLRFFRCCRKLARKCIEQHVSEYMRQFNIWISSYHKYEWISTLKSPAISVYSMKNKECMFEITQSKQSPLVTTILSSVQKPVGFDNNHHGCLQNEDFTQRPLCFKNTWARIPWCTKQNLDTTQLIDTPSTGLMPFWDSLQFSAETIRLCDGVSSRLYLKLRTEYKSHLKNIRKPLVLTIQITSGKIYGKTILQTHLFGGNTPYVGGFPNRTAYKLSLNAMQTSRFDNLIPQNFFCFNQLYLISWRPDWNQWHASDDIVRGTKFLVDILNKHYRGDKPRKSWLRKSWHMMEKRYAYHITTASITSPPLIEINKKTGEFTKYFKPHSDYLKLYKHIFGIDGRDLLKNINVTKENTLLDLKKALQTQTQKNNHTHCP